MTVSYGDPVGPFSVRCGKVLYQCSSGRRGWRRSGHFLDVVFSDQQGEKWWKIMTSPLCGLYFPFLDSFLSFHAFRFFSESLLEASRCSARAGKLVACWGRQWSIFRSLRKTAVPVRQRPQGLEEELLGALLIIWSFRSISSNKIIFGSLFWRGRSFLLEWGIL